MKFGVIETRFMLAPSRVGPFSAFLVVESAHPINACNSRMMSSFSRRRQRARRARCQATPARTQAADVLPERTFVNARDRSSRLRARPHHRRTTGPRAARAALPVKTKRAEESSGPAKAGPYGYVCARSRTPRAFHARGAGAGLVQSSEHRGELWIRGRSGCPLGTASPPR
jgi:hypothetical protein